MAKRIKKTAPPEQIRAKFSASSLERFCEVYIPQAPSVYTYGIPAELPEGVEIRRGSVVWVQFATRKTPLLAIVSKIVERPPFDVRCAYPHASGYAFSERFMETLEWVARYYVSTPMKALDVFLPAQFDKYLDALADDAYFRKNCQTIIETRAFTQKALTDLGFTMTDSLANFLFVKHEKIGGKELYLTLKERGILIRHFETDRLKDYNRITIGSMEQMEELIEALKEILQ